MKALALMIDKEYEYLIKKISKPVVGEVYCIEVILVCFNIKKWFDNFRIYVPNNMFML